MQINKVKSYLGFAVKSKNIIFGYDKLFEGKRLPKLIIVSSTLNDKVTNKVCDFAKQNSITYIVLTKVALEDLIGRACKVVGITDINLSDALLKELKNGK